DDGDLCDLRPIDRTVCLARRRFQGRLEDQSRSLVEVDGELTGSVVFQRMWPADRKLAHHASRMKLGQPALQLFRRLHPQLLDGHLGVLAQSLDVFILVGDFHGNSLPERLTKMARRGWPRSKVRFAQDRCLKLGYPPAMPACRFRRRKSGIGAFFTPLLPACRRLCSQAITSARSHTTQRAVR